MSYADADNFKANIEISISDKKVCAYVKKIMMNAELGKQKGIYFDKFIAEALNTSAYCITEKSKKNLINYINENCNLSINHATSNFGIDLGDGVKHIFVEVKRINKRNAIVCRAVCLKLDQYKPYAVV